MSLQIQTIAEFHQNGNSSSKLYKSRNLNTFTELPIVLHPSDQILTQLRQIQLTSMAHFHYLTALRKKSFRILSEQDYEFQMSLLQTAFLSFKYLLVEKRQINKKKQYFYSNLILFHESKRQQKQKYQYSIAHYQHKLFRNVLYEMHQTVQQKKKQEAIQNYLKRRMKQQFMCRFKQRHYSRKSNRLQSQQINDQVGQIYQRNLIRRYLESFKIYCKFNRLEKRRKFKCLHKFVSKLITDKQFTLRTKQDLKRKKYFFQTIQENKLQKQCLDWYKYRLQKAYFEQWTEFYAESRNQKQIQESNQIILSHYLESKHSQQTQKISIKYFTIWKAWLRTQKQTKKQNQILKSYAEIKERQFLQRKYFQALKQNKNHQKSQKFHKKKLSFKAIESLRTNLITESRKLQKIYDFTQKISLKKYFDRINVFNSIQNKRLNLFLLKKYWMKLTLKITMQYFEKIQKAKNYHSTLLKFKAILSLKKDIQTNRKACYCAYFLNVLLPLQRWNCRFNIRRFVQIKQTQVLKRTFFEWKLSTLRNKICLKGQKYSEQPSKVLQAVPYNFQSALSLEVGTSHGPNFSEMLQSKIKAPPISNNFQSNYTQQLVQQRNDQISFFKKFDQSFSDDQIQKKVDSLINRINSQRKGKQKSRLQSGKSLNDIKQKQVTTNSKQNFEKIRLPTWSTPGNLQTISVFEDDDY